MSTTWPPNGFSEPQAYEKSDPIILGIGVVVALMLGVLVDSYLVEGAEASVQTWSAFGTSVGFDDPVLAPLAGGVVAILGIYLICAKVMIPIHERIHYEVGDFFDHNPEYGTDDSLFMSNPCVTAMSSRIPAWENLVMLAAPCILIGFGSVIVMFLSSGILAGTAAFILLTNSAASSQDLYHVGKILFLPKGTEFANFEEDGDVRTEYVYPNE